MLPGDVRATLLDRDRERTELERLIKDVRGEESQVLVLRGDSGVGRSELLDWLAASAHGCRVMRIDGVPGLLLRCGGRLPVAGPGIGARRHWSRADWAWTGSRWS